MLASGLRLSSRVSALSVAVKRGRQQKGGRGGGGGGRRSNHQGSVPLYIYGGVGGTVVVLGMGYYSLLDEAPMTGRRRWIATSPEWESQLGEQEYRQLLRNFRKDVLPPTHRASKTLNRVGKRIADASLEFTQRYHLPDNIHRMPYTYTVVRSDTANAFVLPGNHVFVFTGLFRYVHDEDELAVVLAHEISHNLCRHVGEKISGSLLVNLLARLSLLFDPSGLVFTILLPAASVFRELPNSRVQEMEADQIGLHLAANACYDPRAAKAVFSRMKQGLEGEGGAAVVAPPEFLSTHPSHDTRLAKFDEWIPQAMQILNIQEDKCRYIRQQMQLACQAAAADALQSGIVK